MPNTQLGLDVIKWGSGIVAGIAAFFALKSRIVTDIEIKLKLRLDLVHAEIEALQEQNRHLKLTIEQLTIVVGTKLTEREHNLLCTNMRQEVGSLSLSIQKDVKTINDCLTKEFKILHKRMNERRITNGVNHSEPDSSD